MLALCEGVLILQPSNILTKALTILTSFSEDAKGLIHDWSDTLSHPSFL